jgi:hypothetical protein
MSQSEKEQLENSAFAIGWTVKEKDGRIALDWYGPGTDTYLFDTVDHARCFLRGFQFAINETVSF